VNDDLVFELDHAIIKDLRSNACAAFGECVPEPWLLCERRRPMTWVREFDPAHTDRSDGKFFPDKSVQIDPAGYDIATSFHKQERFHIFRLKPDISHSGLLERNERDMALLSWFYLRKSAFSFRISVTDKPSSGARFGALPSLHWHTSCRGYANTDNARQAHFFDLNQV
jgi:hypothetical protein